MLIANLCLLLRAAVDCQLEFLSLASFIISDNPVPQRLKKYEL